jgi:hypothetical protein
MQRASRKRHGRIGHQVDLTGGAGQDEREEGVVSILEAEKAIGPNRLEFRRPGHRIEWSGHCE